MHCTTTLTTTQKKYKKPNPTTHKLILAKNKTGKTKTDGT